MASDCRTLSLVILGDELTCRLCLESTQDRWDLRRQRRLQLRRLWRRHARRRHGDLHGPQRRGQHVSVHVGRSGRVFTFHRDLEAREARVSKRFISQTSVKSATRSESLNAHLRVRRRGGAVGPERGRRRGGLCFHLEHWTQRHQEMKQRRRRARAAVHQLGGLTHLRGQRPSNGHLALHHGSVPFRQKQDTSVTPQ